MDLFKKPLMVAITNLCFFIPHCNGVTLKLGETKSVYVINGNTLLINCLLNSGTLDVAQPRSWTLNGHILKSDGIPSATGIGYSEIIGTDRFSLSTPGLNFSTDGSIFQCYYGFSQAFLTVKITDIGSTDQSTGDCIDGKSIVHCWFSLSNIFPDISSQNLTVVYEDNTVEDITANLTVTSRLNADGKTRSYYFKILPFSNSKNVKAIKLSFLVGPISRSLSINMIYF